MSVIGHGDIAGVLPQRDDLLFFASGVSNSREKRESEYEREVMLLMRQDRASHIVYFSTLAIFYSDTPYTRHKLRMEAIVKTFSSHTIIRIGNITFGYNPKTIINHFRNQLKRGVEPKIQDVYRHLISKEEFLYWVDNIPSWNCEMNVPGSMMKVQEIVDEIKKGLL